MLRCPADWQIGFLKQNTASTFSPNTTQAVVLLNQTNIRITGFLLLFPPSETFQTMTAAQVVAKPKKQQCVVDTDIDYPGIGLDVQRHRKLSAHNALGPACQPVSLRQSPAGSVSAAYMMENELSLRHFLSWPSQCRPSLAASDPAKMAPAGACSFLPACPLNVCR